MTHSAQIVLSCAPSEADKARDLALAATTPIVVSGEATLLQYAALLRAADLVVCNDSSALHIAAAVGSPIVVIFGPTKASEKAPLHGRQRVLTPYGDPEATGPVEDVSLERVIAAADDLLREAAT
jgi:heptosyltransferase-3